MNYSDMKASEMTSRQKAQHKQYLKRVALGIQRKSTISGTQCKSQAWRNSVEYKNWKFAVLATHNNTCTTCGTHEKLQAHHIKAASKFPALRYEVSNGDVKCHACHKLIKE